MGVDLQGEGLFMAGTQWRFRGACFSSKSFSEGGRIKGFFAYLAVNKIQRNDFIPLVCQHMLEFNGLLGTYAPAIAAACAARHVVQQLSLCA
jgi:hypothetical protein